MNTPQRNLKEWDNITGMFPQIIARTDALTAEIITPVFGVIDAEGPHIVAALVEKATVDDNAEGGLHIVNHWRISIPGLCGHYKCGDYVEVCLN